MGCAGVVGPRDKPREVMTFEPAQVEEDKKWLFEMSNLSSQGIGIHRLQECVGRGCKSSRVYLLIHEELQS